MVTTGRGIHVPIVAVHEGVSVIVVVEGGRVVTWVVVDVKRLSVTTWSVLVKVGILVHEDISTTFLSRFYRCRSRGTTWARTIVPIQRNRSTRWKRGSLYQVHGLKRPQTLIDVTEVARLRQPAQ